MKAISPTSVIFFLLFAGTSAGAGELPAVSGAWTELRKAPVFTAEALPLAKTWGPTVPAGGTFEVEKVYGRWVFGRPTPLKNMKPGDFAPPGWVFGRMLLLPGDSDTQSPALARRSHAVIFHGRAAWKKLGLCRESLCSPLDFLESLTLSRRALAAFSGQNETASAAPVLPAFSLLPSALAEEEEKTPPMGLAGTDLNFLDQEIRVVQSRKTTVKKKQIALKLRPPPAPPLDGEVRGSLLGRFMLQRYLELPPLSLEEVDGFLYMKATALRALEGCPREIRDFWKGRNWNFFRVFGLKSRAEEKHPWLEVALPGGYFALSGRAIERAGSEAELAFLLVRQLVREPRVKRRPPRLDRASWPAVLETASEEVWEQVLRAQSTKESESLDVADEIAVDLISSQCISRAGYRPLAGIAYLRKLALNRDAPWAGWLNRHAIGLDYRIERSLAQVQEALAKQKFPEGTFANSKRFATASRLWNVLP